MIRETGVNFLEEIVKYNSIKQNLIDEMPKYYSDIELRKLGRLLGIADYDFIARGATKAEICESLITIIYQRESVESLIHILNENENLKRNAIFKIVNFDKDMVAPEKYMESNSNCKMILHISDIHFSKKEDVSKWLLQLNVDLKSNLNTSIIDYLIISGDITNVASGEEFEYALAFIRELIKDFKLQREKIIIVPGNHDYNRDTTIAAMDAEKIINDKLYWEKFDSFQRFHANATGKCYSECIEQQGIINVYDVDKLLVLGLNSSWAIDHINKYKASINMDVLYEVARKILGGQYEDYLKIAVFHHPVTGPEQMNSEFMELLAQMGFKICIHGHIHEAKDEYFNYDDKRKIRVIGAGTFGAITKEQVPGIPHQYNLIRWYSDYLEVHTRKKEKSDGGWKADARWCDNENPKSYYKIELT